MSVTYFLAVFGSLALHGLIVFFMLGSWQKSDFGEITPQINVVKAQLVEMESKAPTTVKTEVIDLTARREAERRAEEERRLAQRKRDEEEKRKLEEQRRKDEEAVKERDRLANEQQRQKEAEQKELDRQQALQDQRLSDFEQALIDEQGYQAELQEQQLVASVGYEIERVVELSWSRPPSARRGMEVVLRVSLVPTGGLSSVEILDSSGDQAFDLSATQAVQKAAPYDAVKGLSSVVFEKNFRTFQFRFSPQDLRL